MFTTNQLYPTWRLSLKTVHCPTHRDGVGEKGARVGSWTQGVEGGYSKIPTRGKGPIMFALCSFCVVCITSEKD